MINVGGVYYDKFNSKRTITFTRSKKVMKNYVLKNTQIMQSNQMILN